jgi:large subunit ribosomal protein L24
MSKRLRKGDTVIAIAGNEKGRSGPIIAMKGKYAIVQGMNLRKKAVKPSEENPKGGIIELEAKIDLSNLQLCVEGRPVRLRARSQDGVKELYYVVDGVETTYRAVKNAK